MRTWHSYTTHPRENGRSSSAVSYVILRMGSSHDVGVGHGGCDVAAMSFALEQYSCETK